MKITIRQLIEKLVKGSTQKLVPMILLALFTSSAIAQQYATSVGTSIVNSDVLAPSFVTTPGNVVGAPDGSEATISAAGVVVNVVVGTVTIASDAALVMNFASVPAGKKTYIRVTDITQTGLNLNLNVLGNILGLLQNNTISVTSNGGTTASELVRDSNGNLFIAATPTNAYTQLVLKVDFANSTSQLIGLNVGRFTLRVEHAVTYENTTFTPCSAIPFAFAAINPRATGINITLLGESLQNPEQVLDGINNSSSNGALLQNGQVALATTVSLNVFLGKTVPGTNQIAATISRPGALANLSVLNNITVQAYLGNTPKGTPRSVSSLLGVDLLALFSSNALTSFAFAPGGDFYDRIQITSATLADVNLFTGLLIHELGSRPPVVFTGGDLGVAIIDESYSASLESAALIGSPTVSTFSIACGGFGDYTYSLFNVTTPTGRVLAGTLPSSLSLSPNGTLSGTALTGQTGSYTFDVLARNAFGQTATAQFTVTVENGLPVTLVSFKASSEGTTALLSWSTATETNSDRFDIERSQNGKQWNKIGSVKSNQESNSERFYSFTDAEPLDGQNLYRLKMIDLDRTFAYSSIENVNFAGTAYLYPNPVRNAENLNLNLTDWSKVSLIKVVNAQGKTVFESSNALTTGISTKNLNSGAYVVQVIHKNGTISAHKFVRQ